MSAMKAVDASLLKHSIVFKSTALKILISSRQNDDIKQRLEQKANIGISATNNQGRQIRRR
jgi:hypothetical protein